MLMMEDLETGLTEETMKLTSGASPRARMIRPTPRRPVRSQLLKDDSRSRSALGPPVIRGQTD